MVSFFKILKVCYMYNDHASSLVNLSTGCLCQIIVGYIIVSACFVYSLSAFYFIHLASVSDFVRQSWICIDIFLLNLVILLDCSWFVICKTLLEQQELQQQKLILFFADGSFWIGLSSFCKCFLFHLRSLGYCCMHNHTNPMLTSTTHILYQYCRKYMLPNRSYCTATTLLMQGLQV